MPIDFSRLEIAMPDFGDRNILLKKLGKIVVGEIIVSIRNRVKPDGSAQKENSKEYRNLKESIKGYTTPLWGIEEKRKGKGGGATKESPYLARPSGASFIRTFIPPDSLSIHLSDVRRASGETMKEIGVKLTRKGYIFMGINQKARDIMRTVLENYFKIKIDKMVRDTKHGR
jgi:hypothetical protein